MNTKIEPALFVAEIAQLPLSGEIGPGEWAFDSYRPPPMEILDSIIQMARDIARDHQIVRPNHPSFAIVSSGTARRHRPAH